MKDFLFVKTVVNTVVFYLFKRDLLEFQPLQQHSVKIFFGFLFIPNANLYFGSLHEMGEQFLLIQQLCT